MALISASASVLDLALAWVVLAAGGVGSFSCGAERVDLLLNPAAAVVARVGYLSSAERRVFIASPIWKQDPVGSMLTELVVDAARRGVSVDLVLDGTAKLIDPGASRLMDRVKRAGGRVEFIPVLSRWSIPFYHGRMHAKLMVIDGRVAVVGGRNYAGDYMLPGVGWWDVDLVLEGGDCPYFLERLLIGWRESVGILEGLRGFFMPLSRLIRRVRLGWKNVVDELDAGGEGVGILFDAPVLGERSTLELMCELVDGAVDSVVVVTPYPRFGDRVVDLFCEAVGRGVRVRVVTNSEGSDNLGAMHWRLGRGGIARLVEGGVEVWLSRDVTVHGKVIVVDGRFVVVHSSNFNMLSLYHNVELGVFLDDEGVARRLLGWVDRIVALSARFQVRGSVSHGRAPSILP